MKSRILIALAAALLTWADVRPARADEAKSPYIVSATAEQDLTTDGRPGNHAYIRITILKQPSTPGSEPKVLSHPGILVSYGQFATMTIGQTKAAATQPANDSKDSSDHFSGIRIDAIKPLDQADAIIVTTIWDTGTIIWAQTNSVKVTKAETKENTNSK